MADKKEIAGVKERDGLFDFIPQDPTAYLSYLIFIERASFFQAFLDTLNRKGEGLLTRYLYHDPTPPEITQEGPRIQGILDHHFGKFLYGAGAWDENIRVNKFYGLANGDMEALKYAIEQGIVSRLPEKMQLIEYGAGGEAGAIKPAALISAILREKLPDSIGSYTAIDIVPRFAATAAQAISHKFNLKADSVVCDFMSTGPMSIPKMVHQEGYTPVILLFGNIMANAPDYSLHDGKNARQNVTTYLARMNEKHGIGARILMTYHAESDPAILLNEYQETPEMRAFVLTSFPRAIMHGGIIPSSQYDPFQYWRISPCFDAATKAMKSCAISLKDHAIPVMGGAIPIREGDSFTNAMAHQWDEKDYQEIGAPAGCEVTNVYRRAGSSRGFIEMEVVRPPSLY
jgi:hypothetical protein